MPKAVKKNSTPRRSASLHKTPPAAAPQRPIVDPIFPNPAAFVLPAGILQQDSSIIDDQHDHLVLTLRVPKEMVRKNRPLLQALVEMSASPAADPENGDLAAEGRQHATQ
jgi:hypothetical protein